MMKKRDFFAGILGNIFEHYDSALYAMLAPFLAPLFFPGDPLTALILAYGIMPLGMLSKPLGAFLFGRMGDHFGRKKALYTSLIGMAIVTFLMGCLPTFHQVGFIAPCLLALGRVLQNFFAAGQVVGGAIYVLEHSQRKEKSFLSSLYGATTILGIFLASFGVLLFSHQGSIETSWRFLFFLGALTGVIGILMRRKLTETPDFKKPVEKKPFFEVLKAHPFQLLALIFVSGFSYVTYSFSTSFMNGYLPLISNITKTEAMSANTSLLLLDFLLLPLFGLLAERVSKHRLMLFAALMISLTSLPLFTLLEGASYGTALFVRSFFITFGVAFAAPFHFWALELVPKEHRYTLISIGYTLGTQLIGAPAATIGLSIYQKTGWVFSPALYFILTGSCAFISVLALRKKPAFT